MQIGAQSIGGKAYPHVLPDVSRKNPCTPASIARQSESFRRLPRTRKKWLALSFQTSTQLAPAQRGRRTSRRIKGSKIVSCVTLGIWGRITTSMLVGILLGSAGVRSSQALLGTHPMSGMGGSLSYNQACEFRYESFTGSPLILRFPVAQAGGSPVLPCAQRVLQTASSPRRPLLLPR